MDVPPSIRTDELLAETGAVRRIAQALVRRADLAHDVAQDVMLVALRRPQAPGNLRGWLAAVTRHLAGKSLRSQRIRAIVEAEAAPPVADDAERRTAERLRLHARLADAVIALPEPYRTAVTMRFFDELPPRAIARRLQTSSEVVRKRLQRGLAMLRERLDTEFGERERWAHAFAALGLLEAGSPWLLLSVLAMNKLVVAAAATSAVAFLIFHAVSSPPPIDLGTVADAGPLAATSAPAAHAAAPADPQRTEAVTPPAVPASAECIVHVVDAAERPIVDAVVYGWAAGSDAWTHRATDAHGRCSFGAVDGPGGVLVAADGHAPSCMALAQRRGEHRVVLPEGESVDGTLTVDGQPGAGWRLRLRGLDPDPALPKELAQRLRWRGSDVVCDRNGAFRFTGLERGWTGAIELPRALWLVAREHGLGEEAVPVEAPQRQIDLQATGLPMVRGRVVWSDTGEPVVWPHGMVHAWFADGQNSPALGVEGARDGSFAVGLYGNSGDARDTWRDPVRRPALRAVTLRFEADGCLAPAKLELVGDSLAGRENLVLRLDRAPVTHFVCLDANGAPIAGARVLTREVSEPTDVEGRGTFAGRPADVELVGAPRHRIGPCVPRAPAAGSTDDPLVFVLAASNSIHIRVVGDDIADRRIRLRSTQRLFAGKRDAGGLDMVVHGLDGDGGASGHAEADGSTTWTDFHLWLRTDAKGEARVMSIEPGIPCIAEAVDAFGRTVARTEFSAPAESESADVVVRLLASLASFAGRVVDPDGLPIRGATVELRAVTPEDTFFVNCTTDAHGGFEVRHAGDLSAVRMTLEAAGFVSQQRDDLRIGGDVPVFTLERGRDVEVRVVDEEDRPLDLAPRWSSDRPAKRERLGDGHYRWSDLPAGVVTFECGVGDDVFSVAHDTASPIATIRARRPGSLRFTAPNGWPAVADARNGLVAVARCLEGGWKPVRFWWPHRANARAEQILPGRWRIDLVERSKEDEVSAPVERSLGLSAEVVVRAGEEATAALR
ncbi:MAG: sigma-70 family RNA polymerase sigma factor [Planctomycetes bacterium]|nr:sigma-70 family RNA polymerase sigma factor [Planctomycetota bacterium]